MPPPAGKTTRSSRRVAVRMATERSKSPSSPIQPTAPVYTPRACGSSSASTSMARTLGAPVIEPAGKAARMASSGGWARASSAAPGAARGGDGGERLEIPGSLDVHRAITRHAAQVVAVHVDDHDVLGAILGAHGELLRQGDVFRRVLAAAARALDGACDEAAPAARQEKLGRC